MFSNFAAISYSHALGSILSYWWVFLPVILAFTLFELWVWHIRQENLAGLEWSLLEIRAPEGSIRSPRVMEQFFTGVHGALRPLTWREKFFKGVMTAWFTFEIVGIGGDIRFFIRTPAGLKNLIEAQFFAQYPDAEIEEVYDYFNDLPPRIPNDDYELWGAEFKLNNDDVFPIKTYLEFEEVGSGPDEAIRSDPLTAFFETLNKLRSGEYITIQIIIQPTGPEVEDEWRKEGEAIINKIAGKEEKAPGPSVGAKLASGIDKTIDRIVGIEPQVFEEKKPDAGPTKVSAIDKETADAIARSISKLGFRSGIRFSYIAHKDVYSISHVASIMGSFRQFASQNLNSFRPTRITGSVGTLAPLFLFSGKGFGADKKTLIKKWNHYRATRERSLPFERQYILNTEELATLYHLPSASDRGAILPSIGIRKGPSPGRLPTK
ncbi:MAG: hypothetical protein COV31_00790 [Candidatus Yanofskybacteria bacterium CG10_big_fil_rev_8_21_14_0_10_46_23]|uniref:DUF8128 domain-containing protein n=1 Tax=Candidatus Yanofskybacteria bacterium CG10_big_fil_rev_8_21_14_0_10_46_23 TaxID=1975098 RepID=A0A2H0R5T8_9BACT|nr:MAG: hypothetical protein COV31_00790 [Candidatus Yanofskybacteria bacterium CG10_big_fil_rev_8_21_14_0_10_46_23]